MQLSNHVTKPTSLTKAATKSLGAVVAKATTRAVGGKPLGAGQLGLVNTGSKANLKAFSVGATNVSGADEDGA